MVHIRVAAASCAALLGIAFATPAMSQIRTLSAAALFVDDGSGHTMTIQTPTSGPGFPLTGNYVWQIPIPPPGNPPAGFTFTGTSTNQMLLWDPLTGVAGSWRASIAATLPTGVMHSTAGVVSSSAVALATTDVSGILPNANTTATSANTASTIVARDGAGAFSAGAITASLTGNVTGNVSGSAATFTGSLAGDVTGGMATTVVGFVGGVTAANVAAGANSSNGATAANTANKIVLRDGAGGFAAGTIVANLTGNVTGNITGTAGGLTAAGWASPGVIGNTAANAGNFTTIGATSQGTGTFTALNSTSGAINATTIGATTAGSGVFTALSSTSGTLNATTIGATTAGAGTFTALNSTSGALNATTIGATTAGSGAFTTVSASTSATIGGGTPILKVLSSTATLDFPATAFGTNSDLTVTLTGAALGDVVTLGVPNAAATSANTCYTAWVSAANTITVRFNNYSVATAYDPASAVFRVSVIQF